jgi:probable O-glycosylation ligase (exosortase A-associated)
VKGLVLVYLITAIGAIGAVWRPMVGLYAYVFFAVLRPHFLFGWAGNLSNISDIVGIAMIAGWTLKGFGSWKLGRGRSVTAALSIFTVWVWLSATQALDSSVAYPWGIEMMKILAPFLVGVTTLKTTAHWRTLLWVIVAAQAYVGAEMNLSYLGGWNQAASGYGGMDNNSFGISLVATLGPAFALAMTEKRVTTRLMAAVCALVILHTVLLTFSRGAFVALLVVGATAFLIMPKRPIYVVTIILVALVTVRLIGPQLADRFATAFVASEERDESADSRVRLWRDCLDVALKRPMFGIGPRNWPLIAADYGWTRGKEAHSVWMQTLAETGFPGVGALALFFGLAIFRLWPLARSRLNATSRLEAGGAMGVILSIVGFAVAGQFVTLTGLEIPYYTTLVGVVLVKSAGEREAPATAGARWRAGISGRRCHPRPALQARRADSAHTGSLNIDHALTAPRLKDGRWRHVNGNRPVDDQDIDTTGRLV